MEVGITVLSPTGSGSSQVPAVEGVLEGGPWNKKALNTGPKRAEAAKGRRGLLRQSVLEQVTSGRAAASSLQNGAG